MFKCKNRSCDRYMTTIGFGDYCSLHRVSDNDQNHDNTPAIERSDGTMEWWIKGRLISSSD